jgi:hypothetical protein
MSAWMYSMMWPMWNGPLAYGSAVVTKSFRAVGEGIAETLRKPRVSKILAGNDVRPASGGSRFG